MVPNFKWLQKYAMPWLPPQEDGGLTLISREEALDLPAIDLSTIGSDSPAFPLTPLNVRSSGKSTPTSGYKSKPEKLTDVHRTAL